MEFLVVCLFVLGTCVRSIIRLFRSGYRIPPAIHQETMVAEPVFHFAPAPATEPVPGASAPVVVDLALPVNR